MYNAALLLVTLSLLCASAAAQPKGTVLASSGASSLTVLPPSNGNVVLKAVLGPCTGAQIHTHNRTEYATAAKSNTNPIKMVYLEPSGKVVSADVKPGGTFTFPASFVHYQVNYGCKTQTFYAMLKMDGSTQLLVAALDSIPDRDFSVFATTKAAVAKPGFLGTDPVCLKSCKLG
jgi:hypothetical protein